MNLPTCLLFPALYESDVLGLLQMIFCLHIVWVASNKYNTPNLTGLIYLI